MVSGNKGKGRKRYTPQRNSVAYALLITLHRLVTSDTLYVLLLSPLCKPFFRTVLFFWLYPAERLRMGRSSCAKQSLLMLLKLVASHTLLLGMYESGSFLTFWICCFESVPRYHLSLIYSSMLLVQRKEKGKQDLETLRGSGIVDGAA